MPVKQGPRDNLRQDVRGIVVTGYLVQREAAGAEPLLHPELADRQVANSSDAGPATNADGGRVMEQRMTWDFWMGLAVGIYVPIFLGLGVGILRERERWVGERNLQKAREAAEQLKSRKLRVVQ